MAIPEPQARELRPTDISGQRFTLTRRGYDPDEVQDFLRSVAEHLSRLQGEIEWQRARSEHLERRGSSAQETAYARLSRVFMDVVRRADEAATRVRIAAEGESKVRVDAAREEAARIVIAAQDEADRIRSTAQEEAGWLTDQAKEAVERARRMASGVHPSTPRAASSPAPPASQIKRPTVEEVWRPRTASASPAPSLRPEPDPTEGGARMPELDDLDLGLDASLFDLFGDPDA